MLVGEGGRHTLRGGGGLREQGTDEMLVDVLQYAYIHTYTHTHIHTYTHICISYGIHTHTYIHYIHSPVVVGWLVVYHVWVGRRGGCLSVEEGV